MRQQAQAAKMLADREEKRRGTKLLTRENSLSGRETACAKPGRLSFTQPNLRLRRALCLTYSGERLRLLLDVLCGPGRAGACAPHRKFFRCIHPAIPCRSVGRCQGREWRGVFQYVLHPALCRNTSGGTWCYPKPPARERA